MTDRDKIINALDSVSPSQAEKEQILNRILQRASDPTAVGKGGSMRKIVKKPVLIAAVIVMMAILMGSAVISMSLESMKIGEVTFTAPTDPQLMETVSEDGTESEQHKMPTMITRDVIALFGYNGSDNQLATQEWFDYNQEIGLQLFNSDTEMTAILDKYGHTYCIANWSMAEKLEEVAEKYDLKILAPEMLVQRWQNQAMFTCLGLEDLHRNDANAVVQYYSGRMYQEGGFEIDMTVNLIGEDAAWEYMIGPTVRYMQKEYFYPRYTYLDIDKTDQWMYETADGTEVLLIMDRKQAIIVHDQGDAFFTVTMMTDWCSGGEINYMDCHTLEQVADVFDYSVRPGKPDVQEAKRLFDEAEKAYEAEQAAKRAEAEAEWDKIGSWEEYFSRGDGIYVENAEFYTLKDFNGDGIDELFLSDNTDYFTGSLTIAGGDHCFYIWPGYDGEGYFCQGNVIEVVEDNEYFYSHAFYAMKPDYPFPDNFAEFSAPIYQKIEYIEHDWRTGIWTKSAGQDKPRTEITEEEAYAIINSYTRIPLDMKPISEFPMEDTNT